MPECEFCKEFGSSRPNRFREIYSGIIESRVVERTENFVAVPTLGQLFDGSLLVIPVAHFETCAMLPRATRDELLALVARMMDRSSDFGEPIFFEHGATASSAGGCGIHHAHLHIVPIPQAQPASKLFPEFAKQVSDLDTAWTELAGIDHYLLLGDRTKTLYRDVRNEAGRFPSQFFRRQLVEEFGLSAPWDWRAYDRIEPALIRTLAGHQRYAV